jgi:protein-S-isoprenylcysteine O-methyltransferase Ste14
MVELSVPLTAERDVANDVMNDIVRRLIFQTLVWFGAFGVILFGSAGTIDWPGAWLYLAWMIGAGLGIGLWFAKHDPGLLDERMRPLVQRDQPFADKVLITVLMVLMFAWLVLMGLDRRFAASSVPPWAQAGGVVALGVSIYVSFLTMRANTFAAPVVKIQRERGQSVVTTGPYRYVRHPMYAGAIFYFVGMALLLGSWWGLAAAPVLIGLLAIRIPIEERALRGALDGYDAYAARVRYRLIPGLW